MKGFSAVLQTRHNKPKAKGETGQITQKKVTVSHHSSNNVKLYVALPDVDLPRRMAAGQIDRSNKRDTYVQGEACVRHHHVLTLHVMKSSIACFILQITKQIGVLVTGQLGERQIGPCLQQRLTPLSYTNPQLQLHCS